MNIKTKELHEVLTRCYNFVSEREFASTGFKCFKFDANVIRAFAKDKGIEYTMADFDFGGSYFIDAEFLVSAIKELSKFEIINVEFKKGKMHFESESGMFLANISASIPEEDFNFPKVPETVKELPEQFFWFVDKIYFATMKDPVSWSRYSGIFMDKNVFYATNNFVIAKYSSGTNLDETFTMPDELVTDIKNDESSVLLGYFSEEERFWLKFARKGTDEEPSKDTFMAFSNSLEKPIDVKRLRDAFETYPKDSPVCEYLQDAALQKLQAVYPWTEGTSKRMTLELQKNKMIFTSKNEIGDARGEVRCNYVGEPISYVFGFDSLKECIAKMKKFSVNVSGERCRLYFTEGGPLELLLISLVD
jgi:hypothetical protein